MLLLKQVSCHGHFGFITELHSPTSFLFFFPTSCPDRYGLIHQARISASVNAMRVLNTGTEVEAAVADALVSCCQIVALRRKKIQMGFSVTVNVFMQRFLHRIIGLPYK